MIRWGPNEFTVGSPPPAFMDRVGSMTMPVAAQIALESYVQDEAWQDGESFLILGAPLTGKTSVGLYLMRAIFKAHPEINPTYWTEADFHADLRNLWRFESLVEKSANDAPLWGEYMEWERSFWDLKETKLLFLDDLGRGSTPNQRYEIESMLRRRRDLGLGTIAAVDVGAWGAIPHTTQSLFKEGQRVELKELVHAGR